MKKMFLLLSIMLGVLNTHAIEFSSKETNPLNIVITASSSSGGYYYGFDSQKKVRLYIYPEVEKYVLRNSAGAAVSSEIKISKEEMGVLLKMIKTVSENCPLTLEINRETITIEKAKLGCDILATSQSEAIAG